MKRILTTMCALTLLLAASVPALAAEPEQSASYYPTSVEEYMEGDSPRIKKVYQLSLADDPSQIPTEDFERDGRLYYLLDMTRKDEVGVDIQTITQTKTLASETNNMEKILQSLEPQMEVTTEDGYTGTLTLDHTTVKVAADGYANGTNSKQIGQIGVLSTEHGPDPSQKFGGGKRFGQVVVCSNIQTLYPLRNFCAGGQKQSWGFDSIPTQSLQYLQPV